MANAFTGISIKGGNHITIKENTLNNNTKGISVTGGEDIIK